MSGPWNNWYHVMGSTKGTWPRGDFRGWRARHHREHCEGDYKHPPPREAHAMRRRRSIALMAAKGTRIVELTWSQRVVVCREMTAKMIELGTEVVDFAMTAKHFHGLVRFTPVANASARQSPGIAIPGLCGLRGLCAANSLQDGRDPVPRHVVGMAKKHAAHMLSAKDATMRGGVFAVRCKCEPIEDREHQIAVTRYIFDHVEEGGAVLSILVREGVIEDVRLPNLTRKAQG